MTQKRRSSGNRVQKLIPRLQTIQVCDEKRQQFLDVFSCTPKNVSQQQLGYVFGLFSIDPHEKDAAYIVNFLTSVIRKEYYSRPSRSSFESFESSLKKLNIALGEIVKEGNDSWLGTLDGVICVVAQNNIHFTSCGKANLFLMRNGDFVLLSGQDEDDAPHHPLKTFEDISSGKIVAGDRFIASDRHLMSLFSPDALAKEATRYDSEGLFRLIHTALVNECELAGSLIAHIQPDTAPTPLKRSTPKKESQEVSNFNAFGQSTGAPSKKKKDSQLASSQSRRQVPQSEEQTGEYIDEKTGHIYIKQDNAPEPPTTHSAFLEQCQQLWHVITDNVVDYVQPRLSKLTSHFRSLFSSRTKYHDEDDEVFETPEDQSPPSSEPNHDYQLKKDAYPQSSPWQEKLFSLVKKVKRLAQTTGRKLIRTFKTWQPTIGRSAQFLLPSFRRIRELFSRLSYERKVIALIILLLIIVVPFFLSRPQTESDPQTFLPPEMEVEVEETEFWSEQWEQEKNTVIAQSEAITLPPDIDKPLKNIYETNDARIYITETTILTQSKETDQIESISLPFPSSALIDATYMRDLSLLFLLGQQDGNRLFYAYSPITNALTENALPIPPDSTTDKIASYLTYVYTINNTGSAICRYARIPGGFSDCVSWLDEEVNTPPPVDWEISGNIFVLGENGTIQSFFQGASTNFSLSETFVPFDQPTDIIVNADETLLFLLDQNNGRIAVINAETGAIEQNVVSRALIGSQKILTADENSATLLSSNNEILTLSW